MRKTQKTRKTIEPPYTHHRTTKQNTLKHIEKHIKTVEERRHTKEQQLSHNINTLEQVVKQQHIKSNENI